MMRRGTKRSGDAAAGDTGAPKDGNVRAAHSEDGATSRAAAAAFAGRGSRGAARWAVLVAFAVLAVLFWRLRIIAPAYEMTFGASDDPYGQIYPMAWRAAEWVRQGILPLWNPYQFAGHPFLATVLYGIFYPPNVLLLLLPTEIAMEASAVLHLVLAATFTYAFLREIRFTELAAFGGAITFALSGFFASQALWFMPAWGAGVWLPASLFAVERLVASGAPRWAGVLALCVAMPVLAGWLQLFVYTMYLVGAYLGFRVLETFVVRETRRLAIRAALFGGAGIAVGIALSAVQLLPSVELQSLGPRQPGGLSVEQMVTIGIHLPQQLLADAINPKPGFPRAIFVGDVWLLLVPVSLLALRRRPVVALFWLVSIFAALVALTIQTPVFELYRMLPAAGWFRYPPRLLFLYAFSAAVLLACALEVLLRVEPRSRRSSIVAGLVAVSGLLWIALSPNERATWSLVVPLVLLVGAMLAPSASARNLLVGSVVAVQAATLFFATKSPALHPYHDLTVFHREKPIWDRIRAEQGTARTYIHYPSTRDIALMPKQGVLQGIYSITDYEPLSLERTANYYRAMESVNPDTVQKTPPFIGLVNVDLRRPVSQRFLNMLGVRYAVVPETAAIFLAELPRHGWSLSLRNPTTGTFLYENRGVLPRAWVVPRAQKSVDAPTSLAIISHPGFRPLETVVLETRGTDPPVVRGGAPATRESPGASIESYGPDRIRLRVDEGRSGWLVLSDTWYPGWNAYVGGTKVAIHRANYLFRAVAVEGGDEVELLYEPRSFAAGAGISLAALLVLAAALRTARA